MLCIYLVVTSYDPIWYLFHSMVSYHQAIWTDCNDYDLIASKDLDNYPEAYTAFCDQGNCGGMELDDAMYYGGLLPDKQWAFISKQDLTVRKAYNFEQWNILYDLGNGEGFYTDSGLAKYCKGKLNSEWFKIRTERDDIVRSSSLKAFEDNAIMELSVGIVGVVVFGFCIGYNVYTCVREKEKTRMAKPASYGTV